MKTLKSNLIGFGYIVIIIILLILSFQGTYSDGDFVGYVRTGNDVLKGINFYTYLSSVWPPLFSIVCIPIALAEKVLGEQMVRLFWQSGSLIALICSLHLLIRIIYNTSLSLTRKTSKGVSYQWLIVFIPILLMFKFILDNFSNLQINIYFVALSLWSLKLFIEDKIFPASLLLALTISLKVYTIFFLFYFIFKREYKMSLFTIGFILLLNSICFLYWGFDLTIEYFMTWVNDVIPQSDIPNHKNQSVFGMFYRYFTYEDPSHNLTMEIFNWPVEFVHKLTYLSVAVVAIYPMYLFRKKLSDRNSLKAKLEYALVFAIIPLLSIISWKAYFIFLWMPMFLVYKLIFHTQHELNEKAMKWIKRSFIVSCILLIVSSEIFTGKRLSDYLEAYSVIAIGTAIIAIIMLYFHIHSNKLNWKKDNNINP